MRSWYFKDPRNRLCEVVADNRHGKDSITLNRLVEGNRVYCITYKDWKCIDKMQSNGVLKFLFESSNPIEC